MDFNPSETQAMILDSAERLLSDTSGVEDWRRARAQPLGFDEARWEQFAELGLLALPLPEHAGGLGGSLEDLALLGIAFGRALAMEPYASTVALGGYLLEAARSPLLGAIAEGGLRLALAHWEPDGDPLVLSAAQTAAVRDGDGFVLSGTKCMVLDAPAAHRLVITASLEGTQGTALFLVERDAAGIAAEDYPLIDGTWASDLIMRDVRIGADCLLAGPEAGAALLGQALARLAIVLMAEAVGAMEACMKVCADYVRERKQFGVAIGSFQAIQHIMADMFVAAHQARSMLYHAIANADREPRIRDAALSAARIVIGEAGQVVSRNGIQVHGGYGLTDEYAPSHYSRRLMALEKSYGDLERHTRLFGDHCLGG